MRVVFLCYFYYDFLYSMIMFAHSAGGVVLNPKGEVLVVRQKDGSWSLPKGHIQEGEDPKTAALREIREETGLERLSFIKLLGSYSRYSIAETGMEDASKLKRLTIYLFVTPDFDVRSADPRIPEVKWVEKSAVASLLTHPKDQEFFRNALPEL